METPSGLAIEAVGTHMDSSIDRLEEKESVRWEMKIVSEDIANAIEIARCWMMIRFID